MAVPTLTVQTFVENSIKYADPQGTLHLRIKTSLLKSDEGEYLDISVSDNGMGYPDDWVEAINENSPSPDAAHVGLTNLRQRFAILYKGREYVSLWNDHGAVAEMILPIESRTKQVEVSG